MNKVLLTGNVAQIYDNGDHVRLSIADNYKDGTNYISVALYDQKATFAKTFVRVGDHVYVEGSLGTYKDPNDKQKERLCVRVWSFGFEGYKKADKGKYTTDYDRSSGFTDISDFDLSSEVAQTFKS